MDRRHLLALVASSAVIGGCTDESPFQIGLGRIYIDNHREESLEVDVVIEKNEEVAYENTNQLEGADKEAPGTDEIIKDWMAEKAAYNVIVSIVGTDLQRSFSTEDADELVSKWGDNECMPLTVTIEGEEILFAMGAVESCEEVT